MAAPNEKECAKKISDLMTKNRWKRLTMSDPYFRDLMVRSRIEESFLYKLNAVAADDRKPFAVVKINKEYVAVRGDQRRVEEDKENYQDTADDE